jgi:putative oxidoreductase
MNETDSAAWGTAALRIALGVVMVSHALLKILVFTVPGTVAFFASVGFPGAFAYPVIAAELLGGAALILGFKTRWAALGLVPVLLGATFVHVPNGWVFNAPNGGWEYPALLTIGVVVQALLGSGAFALDARQRQPRSAPAHA